jgi:hypothetical protein
MADEDHDFAEAALQQYAWGLKRVHRQAGEPSYKTMMKSSKNLSAATLSRLLSGKHNPSWPVVEGFLTACGVSQEERSAWLKRWGMLRDIVAPIGEHQTGNQVPDGFVRPPADAGCPRCGLMVANPVLHEEWHTQWVPATDSTDEMGRRLLNRLRLVEDNLEHPESETG